MVCRVFVQPAYGGKVRFLKVARDPYHRAGFQSGDVGQDLTQVSVVRSFKLIFYQYKAVVLYIAREDIRGELLYWFLNAFQLQGDANSIRKACPGCPRAMV